MANKSYKELVIGKTVLIIDDTKLYLKEYFKRLKTHYDFADTYDTAIMLLKTNQYDLIILDQELGTNKNHTGESLIPLIRASQHKAYILANSFGSNRRLLKAGANQEFELKKLAELL